MTEKEFIHYLAGIIRPISKLPAMAYRQPLSDAWKQEAQQAMLLYAMYVRGELAEADTQQTIAISAEDTRPTPFVDEPCSFCNGIGKVGGVNMPRQDCPKCNGRRVKRRYAKT